MPLYGFCFKNSTKEPRYCYKLKDKPSTSKSFHGVTNANNVEEVRKFFTTQNYEIESIEEVGDHVLTQSKDVKNLQIQEKSKMILEIIEESQKVKDFIKKENRRLPPPYNHNKNRRPYYH